MIGAALPCDRRSALALAAAACALAAAPAAAFAHAAAPRSPVLAFFADRPLVDRSGALGLYRPPAGYGGGAAAARLDLHALHLRGICL